MRLLKVLVAAVWALSVALASASEIDPPAVVGRLNFISGPVSFAPAEANDDWGAAMLNRPITSGDRLWTDANGRAEFHVGSLAVRMAARTNVDVLDLDERTVQLRVPQGDANLRVRQLAADKVVEIATPGGAVVVRQPGSYRVSVHPSSASVTVAVRGGGLAEVFTENSSFLVRDSEQATLSGPRQELFAAPPPDEFDQWAAVRDRREDRIASTRYVPDEMTGYEDLDHHGAWRTVREYGPVWIPAAVPAGWAPYRYGRWVWISPWGWTWVDDAPWGFAPFHYGRWVWLGNHWAWAPGRVIARPVYAPAMVAFIGGSNFSVSVGTGAAPAVGWVPLGWREPYIPWYRASRTHVQNVNVTHVTNVTNIHTTNITYVNRRVPTAVTVVSREHFVAARPVRQAALKVPARTIAAAPVTHDVPVANPTRTSLTASQPGSRPPVQVTTREAVAVTAPRAPAREVARNGDESGRGARSAGSVEQPRVRVIERQKGVNLPVSKAQRTPAPPAQSAVEPPRANAPVQPAPEAQRPQPQPQAGKGEQATGGKRTREKGAPQASRQPERRTPVTRERDVQASKPARTQSAAPPAATQQQRPTSEPDAQAAARATRKQEQAERRAERERKSAPQTQPRQQSESRPAAPRPEARERGGSGQQDEAKNERRAPDQQADRAREKGRDRKQPEKSDKS